MIQVGFRRAGLGLGLGSWLGCDQAWLGYTQGWVRIRIRIAIRVIKQSWVRIRVVLESGLGYNQGWIRIRVGIP